MSKQIRGVSAFPDEETIHNKGKNYFLGIGINAYNITHFNELFNARKDVEDVCALLCESFHFEKNYSTLLLDNQATRRNIIKTFNQLRDTITENDNLLIYYSGHGFMSGNLGYWIPVDAEKGETADYINNSEVRDYIKEIKARHTLLISDSCFSASLLVRDASRDASDSFDNWEKQKSRWVVISGKGVVSDGERGKNSPFATAIMKNLQQATDEKINIVKLADEVTKSVRFNYEQQAECSPLYQVGHDGGQFVFHKVNQEIPAWEAACAKNQIPDYENFIKKYPASKYAIEAEHKIEDLKDNNAWERASHRNTEQAYLEYAKQFPKGKHYEEAKKRMKSFADEQKWQQAKRQNSVVAFLEYLEIYPDGKHAAEASIAIDKFELQEQQKAENEAKRIAAQNAENERIRIENERLEKEKKLEAENEAKRIAAQNAENERIRIEKERLEKEKQLEAENEAKRIAAQNAEKERVRLEKERLEKERQEQQLETEKTEKNDKPFEVISPEPKTDKASIFSRYRVAFSAGAILLFAILIWRLSNTPSQVNVPTQGDGTKQSDSQTTVTTTENNNVNRPFEDNKKTDIVKPTVAKPKPTFDSATATKKLKNAIAFLKANEGDDARVSINEILQMPYLDSNAAKYLRNALANIKAKEYQDARKELEDAELLFAIQEGIN